MKRKSSSQGRISNPGNPAQALRIDAAKARVDFLEARKEAREATLELRRAEAVGQNGLEIDVGMYQEALDKAKAKETAKKTAWEQARVAAEAAAAE